jgi:hypothetical protein
MNAVVFDTLKLAKKLEDAGFPTVQAQGVAAALADTFSEDLATKRDLKDQETALRTDVQALRTELRTDFQAVRTEFKADLRDLEQRMTIRLGAMPAGAIVLVGAMVKLL